MARRYAWFLLVAALTNCGPAGDGDTPSGEGIQSLDGSSITSFTLIDASTDQPIAAHDPLLDGSVLDLAALGTQSLSIRANTSPATVGSVRFAFDGASNYRTESVAPYALGGDTEGDYNPVALSIGSHTLTATPFSGSGAGGTSGSPLTIEFDVTSGSGAGGTGGTGGSGGSSGSGGSAGSGGGSGAGTVTVSGEKKKWHKLNIDCVGPSVSETASPNPFRDYRMQVTLTNGARTVTVPGYYACDGNAALSGASSGSIWRAHFAPDLTGTWNYSVSFRTGTDVAIGTASGSAGACDGKTGSFTVAASDKTGRDHRGKGLIEYDGSRYLRFADSGERFLKGGADSPENFLAYADFDATTPRHSYAPHAGDWTSADPTWNGRGKNIIGALNYLAARGMNSVYFLTMNVQGDGNDTWPWTSSSVRDRFDCSKLDQWEIVFEHMDRKGLMLHVVTQETENDQLLDGGALGTFRKLYYRELVARFSHHLGLVWNLGEENTNTDAQRKSFATFIRDLDAYDHPNVIHTYPGQKSQVYTPLLGFEDLEGPSLQVGDKSQSHAETLHWINQAEASGRAWFVSVDEIGPASVGVAPDSTDPTHDAVRHQVLWGNLMAGGAGVEWYFGSQDQSLEDWRTRHNMWEQTRHALTFFQAELPFWTMQSADALTTSSTDYVLADEGQVYAIYLPTGGTPSLDFGNCTGTYSVRWYNPRAGGGLATGSVAQVQGPGTKSLGNAPSETTKDWVVLVKLVTGNGNCGTGGPGGGPSVTSLTLINAATDQPIPGYDPLPNGATLDLSNLGTSSLTLRANTSPSVVGSVRFSVDGSSNYQTESVAPYALAGDTNGNYNSWTLGLGAHTVGATAYTGSGAGGSAGTPLSVSFTIVQ